VGLFGAQGTGKTTAMRAVYQALLKKNVPAVMVTETARRCPHPINEGTGYEAQRWIQAEQLRCESEACKEEAVVLTDRTSIDHMAYARWALDNGKMTESEFKDYCKVAIAWCDTYDALCYFPIEFDLVEDGVRSIDPKFQAEIDFNIQEFWSKSDVRVHHITGTVEERTKQIMNIIEDICGEVA
jgi:GTPase SAR1 family protein